MEGLASLKGRVVGLKNNDIIAVVETEEGLAYLDINDTWIPDVKIGDEVEAESCPFYISNGKIITNPTEELSINGVHYSAE